MILLLIGVATIVCLAFGLVAVATSPADLDKAVRQRLATIHSGEARLDAAGLDASNLLKEEDTRQAGWLESALQRFSVVQTLQKYIAQGASSTTVTSLFLTSLGLAVAGFLLTALFAPVLPLELAGACTLACFPSLRVAWRRSRRIAAFATALPDAIDMMARSLRAGHSIGAAIEMVAQDSVEPVASEFREVFKQQNFGLPLRDALTQMLDRVPSQDLRVVVTAIFVQRDTGGNLVEILDRTAFIVRDRQRIQGEIRVHTAQGRMTGWVLSLLPFVMLILINLVNPGYSNILLTDPFGRKLIYIGVGLIVLGAIVIHRIVNGIEV
jgi:tight adherence protein B